MLSAIQTAQHALESAAQTSSKQKYLALFLGWYIQRSCIFKRIYNILLSKFIIIKNWDSFHIESLNLMLILT